MKGFYFNTRLIKSSMKFVVFIDDKRVLYSDSFNFNVINIVKIHFILTLIYNQFSYYSA